MSEASIHQSRVVPEQVEAASEERSGEERRLVVVRGCGMLTLALNEDSERCRFGADSEGITNAEITVHGRLDTPGVSFSRKTIDPTITGNILLVANNSLFDTQDRINRKLQLPPNTSPTIESLADTLRRRPVDNVRYDGVIRYWPMRVDYASFGTTHILLSFVPRPRAAKTI